MKTKFFMVFISLTSVLAGCSTGISSDRYLTNTRDFMVSKGKPTAYVDGYTDGCSTGRRLAGDKKFSYKRDNARSERDALYARGWEEGQIFCRNEVIAEQQREAEGKAEGRGTFFTSVDEERNRRVALESKAADAEVRDIWEELKK